MLITRLVLGEIGHAMPAVSMSMQENQLQALSADDAPADCPEHGAAAHDSMSYGSMSHDSMAHDSMAHDSMIAGANHARQVDAGAPAAPIVGDSDASSETHDCCKSGDCECPCLHVPCAVLAAATLEHAPLRALHVTQGIEKLPRQRLSGVFRPPA